MTEASVNSRLVSGTVSRFACRIELWQSLKRLDMQTHASACRDGRTKGSACRNGVQQISAL
jgi:hypothetical protein